MMKKDKSILEIYREEVLRALSSLTDREQNIIKLRYGLEDGQRRTLETVGGYYCLSRERIRQIEAKALRKLRHPSRSRYLRSFLVDSELDMPEILRQLTDNCLKLKIPEGYESESLSSKNNDSQVAIHTFDTSSGTERTPKVIGFYKKDDQYGCFSNWYLAEFDYAGKHFYNVGQFVMHHKAMLFNEEDLAERIMIISNPQKCYEIGRLSFKEYDPVLWDKQSRVIVKRGVKAKFSQNMLLRNVLLGTRNALLALCSPNDKKWGIGIGIDNPDYRRVEKWAGENMLGTILMEVRDELRHEDLLYSDACDSGLIREWAMTAGELEQIPAFSNAISAYMETIRDPNLRKIIRNDYLLCEVETALKTSSNCLAPKNGFFEMKQEVYDTVRKFDLYHEEEPLKWLIEDYPEAPEDLRLLRSLLSKYYPSDRGKRTYLYVAAEEDIPKRLVKEGLLTKTTRKELATNLMDSYGYFDEFAFEAVDVWAEALGATKDDMELQGVEPEEALSMGASRMGDDCPDEFDYEEAFNSDHLLDEIFAFGEGFTNTKDESNHPGKDGLL